MTNGSCWSAGGKEAVAPFGAMVYRPANNIFAHPEDTIYLYREPQTLLAFGAVANGTSGGGQGRLAFDASALLTCRGGGPGGRLE